MINKQKLLSSIEKMIEENKIYRDSYVNEENDYNEAYHYHSGNIAALLILQVQIEDGDYDNE